ncbi:adhesin [Actinomycetospora sp.]|jgi:Fe-S cluster assembly iron-binding protein IscA|uniref:adhesin n=1 Tax=Actinomycetospora sp. TaxID=1872135 RepID=UPI002F42134B
MLALTETAAEAISNILETNEMPEGSGLRIAATPNMAEEGLELSVAPNPAADDTVLEGGGAVIFLEPMAASALDDKVLDVEKIPETEAEGSGDEYRFAITPQSELQT